MKGYRQWLEWSQRESPEEIFYWYLHRGYDEKEFNGYATWALMRKEL